MPLDYEKQRDYIVGPIGEFIGTAYFLFMGVGGAVNFLNHAENTPALPGLAIPFSFGFSLFVNVFIWGDITGGVFNPSITIALMLTKPNKFPWLKGILYIISQLLGALVGSWLIDLVQPDSPNAATVLGPGVSIAQGLFLEMFATSLLTFAVLMLAIEGHGGVMAPFGIGMSLFVSALCAGPYTGASLNPARTFGPAIVANQYGTAHWIYYVGPTLGSLLAAGYWHLLRLFKVTNVEQPNVKDQPEKHDVESQ